MNVLDAVLNVARVKLLTNRPPLFPHFLAPFLPSLSLSLLSLSLSTFLTRWKMFANKVFGGQCWKVTTRQRHKSEVVIGKERRKRMQRMFASPLFTILLFTRAPASLRGIFTREYLGREIPPFYPFHFACERVENFRNAANREITY